MTSSLISIALLTASVVVSFPSSSSTSSSIIRGNGTALDKRWDCFCEFPGGHGTRAWTEHPDAETRPWAMQVNDWDACKCGMWCQYNCDQGFMVGQWDDTSNVSPAQKRRNGGFYCDWEGWGTLRANRKNRNGKTEKWCLDQRNSHWANMKTTIARTREHYMCSTTLPGSELPLQAFPMNTPDYNSLPLPDSNTFPDPETGQIAPVSFYVNNLDVKLEDACTRGDVNAPNGRGIYAPFVFKITADEVLSAINFTMAWNPIFLKDGWPAHFPRPAFGMRSRCYAKTDDLCFNSNCRLEPPPRYDDGVGYNIVHGDDGATVDIDENGWQTCTTSVVRGGQYEVEVFLIEGA